MWIAMRRGTGSLLTSAAPSPLRPASGFAMQFTASFDQRSPQRFVVTCAGATSLRIRASARARGVSRPSSSPSLKPIVPVSVRIAWPGSYMPAPIVITQPSVRSRPAIAATRSSLSPFWKSTTTPSGRARCRTASAVAHSVSYDLIATKTASNGSSIACASWRWNAFLDGVLAAGPAQAESVLAHRLDVLRPLVYERHVVPRLRQEPAHHAADRPRADDPDSHVRRSPSPRGHDNVKRHGLRLRPGDRAAAHERLE